MSSDGIATALQDSASALMEGGNNLEQAVALVAAANRVVQDPSSVGSALRTISLRLRGTSVEVLEELGEETDNVVESTSKLQKKIKALSGVDILTESGDYKDTYTILAEIGEVWESMSDIDQAALLELMAGKNRANTLSAILSNMKDLEGAYKDALDAEGSAYKENEAYLESIQGRIDLFTNSVQTMWMNTISSDMVKFFVDIGTAVIQLIDKIGGLNVALAALGAYAVLWHKFGGLLPAIGAGIVNLTKSLKGLSLAKIFSDFSGFISIIKEGKTLSGMFINLVKFIGLADTALGKYIISLMTASTVNAAVAGTTTAAGFAFVTLKTAILGATDAIIAFFATNPVGWVILAVAAIIGVVKAIDAATTSHKEYVEQLEETNKEIQDIRSNLESLNAELETTKQRIEELENKGPLALTEQEELDKLKAQNAELERQIQLEEAREQRTRNKQAEQAAGAFDTDKDFKERAAIDINDGVSVTNEFEKKLEDIAKAKEDMENAEIALQEAINSGMDTESRKFKKLEKNLVSAQEDYTGAQSEWDTFMKNKESEYADLEWFDGDNLTESQKKVNQIISSLNNYNDKAEIMFGSAGAKESALDRIFGERGSEAGKAFLTEFNSQVESGAIDIDINGLEDYSTIIDDTTNSVSELISKNPQLKLQLDSLGISAEDVARHFLNIDEAIQQTNDAVSVATTDISSLASAYEAYASALSIANEAIYEGQSISQEHYDSLREYLGDVTVGEEDFSDAIDTNNGRIVKNVKLIKDLINQKKKEQKATVNATKAQSQLQYTKIVKQLQQAIKVMALDYEAYGYVTQATYDNISALREQIESIKDAIREYSALELKLSDVTNAYTEFEEAKNRDAELTYGDSLVEAIQALNDGFATGKVGTETFKAALDLIVPPEAYESLDDYQDRLIAMHDYVDKNKLFADWFTVDKDGNYGIEFKNMAAFAQDMQKMGVFTGDDITGFNFADGVNSIEDIVTKTKEFNDGIGATEATIVAMLTELSKYDARFGDLLSEITMTETDKTLKNTTEALDRAIAKQEQFFKDGKDPYGSDASEYDAIQQEINNCSDAYSKAQQAIIDNTNAWIEANNNVDIAKNKVADLSRELQELQNSDTATETEIKIKTDELEAAKKELSEALQIKYQLGEEPTQMDFQIVLDDVQSQIEKWKADNATLDVDVVPKLKQDQDGTWVIPAEIEADLSEDDKQKIQEYVDLINDEQGLASLLGLVESDPAVSELVQIKDILSEIANTLGISKTVNINEEENKSKTPVQKTELYENKSTISNDTTTSNETSGVTLYDGFSDLSSDVQIAAANEAIEEWLNEFKEFVSEIYGNIDVFFKNTLPTKWNEFWGSVGEKANEIVIWAQELGKSIGEFFNEQIDNISTWTKELGETIKVFFSDTLPQKWDDFWNWVGTELDNLKQLGQELGKSIETFFSDTMPEKWDEFWNRMEELFAYIPYAVGFVVEHGKIFFTETLPEKWEEFWTNVGESFDNFKQWASGIKQNVITFFTKTLPEKWDAFWIDVGNALNNLKDKAIQLKNDVAKFFTETIPNSWNEFWSNVSDYINTNIIPALNACKNAVIEFFTETIPEKWNSFWNSVDIFVTETIPTALNKLWEKIAEFFTTTIPTKWNLFWEQVSEYINTNITPALNALYDKVVEFFTETIPEKWNSFWNSVGTFITETVPTALENIKEGITTFFTVTIPEKINGLWDGISSWISEKASAFWNFLKTNYEAGEKDASEGNDFGTSKESGAAGVRGNALAKGNAHSKTNVGLNKNEHNAVVGELGRELVVDPNKGVYYTVGDNGTEMVDLPKGAIIYNHKQTEELLRNGYTSRGKLTGGLSFAKGNAHPTTSNSDGYNHGLFGGYLSDDPVFKDTSRQWIEVNEDWVEDFANAADGIIDASDTLSDAADEFKETVNWIEVLFTRIDNILAEQEALFETIVDSTGGIAAKESIYNTMYGQMYNKASYSLKAAEYYSNLAETILSGMDAVIAQKVRNGTILIEEITDEKLKENIDKALEYLDQKSQYTQQYYQTIVDIADKAKEHLDEVAKAYENEISLVEHLNDMLEAHNDLVETRDGFATEAYYNAQISAQKTLIGQYEAERRALQSVLDQEVALGHVQVGSDQWFEMVQAIYDVEDAIIDTQISIEDLQNSINDLKWDRFDELINRFEYIEDEIGNVIQLFSHDPDGLIMEELRDLTSGNWASDSGLATIGLYAQEMERAQHVANQYADAIKDLKKDYAAGKYNETEYLSKLNELISAQYENIEKYYDAKDAIIELNEARVDAIRDGIEKEIDAYDELIQKKKELLDKERDEHDFKNEIAEKEKEVSDIRKQLAAMDGDNTAATTAKKKKLEAELLEAQKALEESYYDHSMNSRQEALDKEFSDFEDEKNAEIEKWEEWLTETEKVVSDALDYVKQNTTLVYNELSTLGSQYGLTLSDTLTTPWTTGQMAIDSYSENFEMAVSSFTEMLDGIVLHWGNVTAAAEAAARAQASALQAQYNATANKVNTAVNTTPTYQQTVTPTVQQSTTPSASTPVKNTTPTLSNGSTVTVKTTATHFSRDGGNGTKMKSFVPGGTYTVYQVSGNEVLIGRNGVYTGWVYKTDLVGFAHGTKGVKEDQFAIIDELGEELVINTDGNGRLSYLSKGSGVVPADLTERIFELAMNPASIFEELSPKTKVPNVTANSFDTNLSFGSLVHVDTVSKDTLPELQKMVRSEFNNMMKQVNHGLRMSGAKA